MNLPIGISSQEGIANGIPQFPDSNRYAIGVLMARERGVANKATEVFTIEQDRKLFGNVVVGQFGALITRNIFNNAGDFGCKIVGVRVVGAGSTSASAAVGYTPATTPAWLVTTILAAAAGVYASKKYTVQNVAVGCSYTFGAYTYTATTVNPSDVINGLYAMIFADVAGGALQTIYSVSKDGDSITLQHKTVNTAIALAAPTATAPTYTAIALGTLKAGQFGSEDVGTWANGNIRVEINPYGSVVSGKWLIEVFYKNVKVESYIDNTLDACVSALNTQSSYVTWTGFLANNGPTAKITVTLVGGTYAAPIESDFYAAGTLVAPLGLTAFKGLQIPIIICTEFQTSTMAIAGRDFCKDNRSHFVSFLSQYASDATVAANAALLQTASSVGSFVSSYLPWIQTSDENGGYTWVPAYGWVIGAGFVRVPQQYGDLVHIAPAGEDTKLTDAVNIWPSSIDQASIDQYVKVNTTNVGITKRGKGTYLISSRTMSTNILFNSIHVRRLTNELLNVIEDALGWVIEKPNSPEIRTSIVSQLTTLMKGYYDNGGLERGLKFSEACQIICDFTNNPLSGDRKQLYVDVLFVPSECIEAVRVRVNRNDGVLSISA